MNFLLDLEWKIDIYERVDLIMKLLNMNIIEIAL